MHQVLNIFFQQMQIISIDADYFFFKRNVSCGNQNFPSVVSLLHSASKFVNMSDTTFIFFSLAFFVSSSFSLRKVKQDWLRKYIILLTVHIAWESSITLVGVLFTLVTLVGKNAVVTFKMSLSGFADLTLEFWDLGDGHESFFFLSFFPQQL